MKINVISDLHTDRGIYTEDFMKSDLLIIAGDIASVSSSEYLSLLKRIPVTQRTLIVMGNHEPINYAYNLIEQRAKYLISDLPHITLLENESIIIDGVRFLGTTLWSDFLSSGQEHYEANKLMVAKNWKFPIDYIFDEKNQTMKTVGPEFSEHKTEIAKKFLENELSKRYDGKTVVITHFPPSLRSSETPYIGSNRSAFWVNSYDYLFDYAPDLWIHGHVHESKDYVVESGTRIVCNPRGNVKKVINPEFNPNFYVEI